MPAALNRAQHRPDSMRPRRHCSSSPAFGTPQRCRSNDGIAVEQSQHSVPPTECWDYSAERCRGALERGGVPKRRRRPSSRNEPFVPLLTEIEMQPAGRPAPPPPPPSALCVWLAPCGGLRLQRPWPLQLKLIQFSTPRTPTPTCCPMTAPPPRPRYPLRHRRRRVGVHAPRHEWQHRRRALGIVGVFDCGCGCVSPAATAAATAARGTGHGVRGTGYGVRGTGHGVGVGVGCGDRGGGDGDGAVAAAAAAAAAVATARVVGAAAASAASAAVAVSTAGWWRRRRRWWRGRRRRRRRRRH